MKKKNIIAFLASAAMLLGSMAIGSAAEEYDAAQSAETVQIISVDDVSDSDTDDTDNNDGMVRSFLTGKLVPESIGRTRPIAVMFNNIQEALPQSGISNAEVVYEAPVEGGITRLLGIMEDYQDVERIGSVRSCREYYIYFSREFEATYLHYGEAVYAVELLNLPGTLRLSGMGDNGLNYSGEGDLVYYRSDDFEAPHNVFTNYNMIQAGLEYKGYSTEYSDDYISSGGHYLFADDGETVTLEDGEDALIVAPGYSYNYPYFLYDESAGTYTRYQLGDIQRDYTTGRGLTYNNIILQYCSWTKWDDNGYLDINVYSGGKGKFITNGKAIDITWSKDNPDNNYAYADSNFGVTHYYDMDGNEITLNQGKTWVCIILDTDVDGITITGDVESYLG